MTAPRGRGQIGLTVRVLTGPCAGLGGVVEEADYTIKPAAYRVRFDPPAKVKVVGLVVSVWRTAAEINWGGTSPPAEPGLSPLVTAARAERTQWYRTEAGREHLKTIQAKAREATRAKHGRPQVEQRQEDV
jgi:hypothetical protein